MHPKTAQALAQHSTITLTMDRYSHSYHGEQSAALAVLPDLSESSRQAARATGTDDAGPVGKNLADYLAPNGQRGATSVGACGRRTPTTGMHENPVFSQENRQKQVKKPERAGFEPAVRSNPHTGFRNQLLQPLGHLSHTILLKRLLKTIDQCYPTSLRRPRKSVSVLDLPDSALKQGDAGSRVINGLSYNQSNSSHYSIDAETGKPVYHGTNLEKAAAVVELPERVNVIGRP